MLTARGGTSLVELLVALALAGIVLGAATGSVLRQQRATTQVTRSTAAEAQLRPMLGIVPAELASLSPFAGDLATGQASDTSLQLRAVVAVAVQCDAAVASAVWGSDGRRLDASAVAASPRAGDTLWRYDVPTARWIGRRVIGVSAAKGRCGAAPDTIPLERLALDGSDSIPATSPLRLTRPVRYDLYRAGDGSWQLGLRDWSESSGRFAAPQPIAGPLLRPTGGVQSGFRYFDDGGTELPSGSIDVSRVARLRFTAVVAASSGTVVRDSADVALQR